MNLKVILILITLIVATNLHSAPPQNPAAELIERVLKARTTSGYSVRARLVHSSPENEDRIMQVAIQGSNTSEGRKSLYQILWPQEMKGSAVLLSIPDKGMLNGIRFSPPNQVDIMDATNLDDTLFGTLIQVEDLVEAYWEWPHQEIVGEEIIDNEICTILESKHPNHAKGHPGRVTTWISKSKNTPMKIFKYKEQGLIRKVIRFERFIKRSGDTWVAANTIVENPYTGETTRIEGTRSKQDIEVPDHVFSLEHIQSFAR